jgi:hypothetical protein
MNEIAKERLYNQLELGFALVTGTQTVTSKRPRGSAIGFKGVNSIII